MRVSKKNILKWTAALRSGKYKQTTGVLQNEKGYCCLGVACEIFIKTPEKNSEGFIRGMLPGEEQVRAPDWLRFIDEDFKSRTGVSLTSLNDGEAVYGDGEVVHISGTGRKYKFEEIADLLEAVYVHRVLK